MQLSGSSTPPRHQPQPHGQLRPRHELPPHGQPQAPPRPAGAERPQGRIAVALAAATASLLGGGGSGAAVAEEPADGNWDFDVALHSYREADRVNDASGTFLVRRGAGGGREFRLLFTIDTLTGASASGAAASGRAQTFTSPSGKASYTTPAGETPLDPTFLDTRIALAANLVRPVGRFSQIDVGLSLSNEWDYLHTGVNGRLSRDFNERRSTLTLAAAVARDTIDPEGGAPLPLSPMLPVGDLSNKAGSDDKTVTDFLIGVTQVLGRNTIGQLNYTLSIADGYLTDPYKLLSVVDRRTGEPAPGPGELDLYLFEARPDSRAKHSLFGLWRRALGRDVVDLSYRYMTDDWEIESHTLETRYRWELGSFYLQPHLRYYTQSAAEFYQGALFAGEELPRFASADYRLGELDSYTVGLTYGRPLPHGRQWTVRLEYYEQSGTSPPELAVGSLRDFDQFPSVDALIAETGFRW
jgi:Protein of unknown function (DUF3570)